MKHTVTRTHTHEHTLTHTHTNALTITQYYSWIDSYMDELPNSSDSPTDGESSQPEPDSPEPYIKFEKPVSASPSHQTLDSGCPPDSQSQVTSVGDDEDPPKTDRDSYYSDR